VRKEEFTTEHTEDTERREESKKRRERRVKTEDDFLLTFYSSSVFFLFRVFRDPPGARRGESYPASRTGQKSARGERGNSWRRKNRIVAASAILLRCPRR
jgi:hypothetical protein